MPATDLVDLLRLYAVTGIADWRLAPAELKKRARECLGNSLAENEAEATVTIYTPFNDANASKLKFIPMPKHPQGGSPERSFFLPVMRKSDTGQYLANFELFLLVAAKNCLAFRFEASHPESVHNYGHLQLSKILLKKTIQVPQLLEWLPVVYPAFPLSTSDPLRMFLAMTTAVHGYSTGMLDVFRDMFQKASRARDSIPYVEELRQMLK